MNDARRALGNLRKARFPGADAEYDPSDPSGADLKQVDQLSHSKKDLADSRDRQKDDTDPVRSSYSRTSFRRDSDRILHSDWFQRLAGVGQTTHANDPLRVHSRYSHSMHVAHLGRRIAQRLLRLHGDLEVDEDILVSDHLDVDVVEAACLAHDIGHPPFAHVGERALNAVLSPTVHEGFEGNAQSFRIVTRLGQHFEADSGGLGLTRATLRAIQKYPHTRLTHAPQYRKFGAYSDDARSLEWVRQYGPHGTQSVSLEAAIMDWADDIAYSIHDFEDFYKAGLIRVEMMFLQIVAAQLLEDAGGGAPLDQLMAGVLEGIPEPPKGLAREIMAAFPVKKPYQNENRVNSLLSQWRSETVRELIEAVSIDIVDGVPTLEINKRAAEIVEGLKDFTKSVVRSPAMQSIESGQEAVIRYLFRTLAGKAAKDSFKVEHGKWVLNVVSPWAQEALQAIPKMDAAGRQQWCRTVADYIGSLTDSEALSLSKRLQGLDLGSVADRIP